MNINNSLYGIGFPSLYIQGENAINQLDLLIQNNFKSKSGTIIYDAALEKHLTAFKNKNINFNTILFPGECSLEIINDLVKKIEKENTDCIIGFGAGKTLDTAKAVAGDLAKPLVLMPSAASSDGATSRLVAIYEDHAFKYSRILPKNPDLILADISIIAKAPIRLLKAGIGDALSKRFEVEQSITNHIPNTYGMQSLKISQNLANSCYEILLAHAEFALKEIEQGTTGPHLDSTIEACLLYSGLGFEGGGLSLAHGLLRGLTLLDGTDNSLHGELVAYGLLVQLMACEKQRHHFNNVHDFVKKIGLPSSLKEIGVHEISLPMIKMVAQKTLEAPYLSNNAQGFNEENISNAILELENL